MQLKEEHPRDGQYCNRDDERGHNPKDGGDDVEHFAARAEARVAHHTARTPPNRKEQKSQCKYDDRASLQIL